MSGRAGDEPLDFAILSQTELCGDFRPLARIELTHASLTGGRELRVSREMMRAGTAAVILPFDPARDAIVAIRQFRIGAALRTPHAAALELPAGLLDDGEDAETAARRELAEETGLRAEAIEAIFTILSSPGLCDERVHFFLALVDSTGLRARAGLAEEDEDILPLAFPAADLISSADEGRIANGFLFTALQWFARHGHERAGRLAKRRDEGRHEA